MPNHIGKTFYFSAALPATNDAAGFEALTWTKVDGIQQLPQFGVTNDMIDIPDLQTGFTTAVKGAAQGVDTSAAFHNNNGTNGHAEIAAVADGKGGQIAIKIGRGSGANEALVSGDPVQYAQGIAHSYAENQGDVTTYEGFTIGFRQNDYTVNGTEPV